MDQSIKQVLEGTDTGGDVTAHTAWCTDFLRGGHGGDGSCCKQDERIAFGWCEHSRREKKVNTSVHRPSTCIPSPAHAVLHPYIEKSDKLLEFEHRFFCFVFPRNFSWENSTNRASASLSDVCEYLEDLLVLTFLGVLPWPPGDRETYLIDLITLPNVYNWKLKSASCKISKHRYKMKCYSMSFKATAWLSVAWRTNESSRRWSREVFNPFLNYFILSSI